MLTGDKGKTAKMIGIQCGMLTPLERTTSSHKATKPDIEFNCEEEAQENKDELNQKFAETDDRKIVKQKGHIYYEIDYDATDLNN